MPPKKTGKTKQLDLTAKLKAAQEEIAQLTNEYKKATTTAREVQVEKSPHPPGYVGKLN